MEQLPIHQITWRHTPEWLIHHIAFEISHNHVVILFVYQNADLWFSNCNIFLNHMRLFYRNSNEFCSWNIILCIVSRLWDGIKVGILAVTRNSKRSVLSPKFQDWPRGPSSILFNGYRGPFSRDKVVRA